MRPRSSSEARRIRDLLERRQFAEALAAAQALTAKAPGNRDGLYMQAVSLRYLHDLEGALATLELLERHHPRFSRLYQERGHCFQALQDSAQAIDSYQRGVNINPALSASWKQLERLYRMTGQPDHAAMAATHVANLKNLPPEVVTATALFSDGDLAPAEGIIRAFLLRHGNHVEAMRLLARIAHQREVLDDAEILLEAVLEVAPEYTAARLDYARVLMDRRQHRRAREQLERALGDAQSRSRR